MRVAFLNPMFGRDFTKSARWFARSRGRVQRHPDYLCTAAAAVEAAGHEIYFRDAQAKNEPTEAFLPALRNFGPDLIVLHTTTPSIDVDIAAAKVCKGATQAQVVLVGSHVTAAAEDTLARAGNAVDALALGEYDYTLRDLANGAPIAECPGLAYATGEGMECTAPRPYIEDLDELPFPAWRHIDLEDYRDAGKLFPFLTLLSGRGCFGRCTFCQHPQVMSGRRYRARSAENVLDEIAYDLRLFPSLREIMFEDDTLLAPAHEARLAALCQGLIERRFGIAWSANARVDGADLDALRLMKKAGCRMLCVGFEFGSQQLLDNVHKGTTPADMRRFAENARRAGIRVHGCFMIGGPGETPETARQTIDLALELPIDTAQFSGVVAYPGTEFYEWARDEGCLVPGEWREWVDADFEQVTTVDLPGLPVAAINAHIDEGLRRFYLRPRQMVRMALNIRSWADVRAKWHGLRSFLGYFSTAKPGAGFDGNN